MGDLSIRLYNINQIIKLGANLGITTDLWVLLANNDFNQIFYTIWRKMDSVHCINHCLKFSNLHFNVSFDSISVEKSSI